MCKSREQRLVNKEHIYKFNYLALYSSTLVIKLLQSFLSRNSYCNTIGKERETHTDIQRDRETHTERHTQRHTHRDKQTETDRQRQTDSDRDRQREEYPTPLYPCRNV